MLKFYPDRPAGRVGRLLADGGVAFWVTLWTVAGLTVYRVVEGLQTVADGVSSTGHTFNAWIGAFRNAVPRGIPGVSSFFTGTADALQRASGDQLLALAGQAHGTIDNVALVLGLMTALPPILIVGGAYAIWRFRDAREMGSALAFVTVAERTGRVEQARALLAMRAVSQLSFTELMRISADPVDDLAHHRYEALAGAMLRRAGLETFRLAPVRAERLEAAAPSSEGVGAQGQEHDQDPRRAQRQVGRLGPGERPPGRG